MDLTRIILVSLDANLIICVGVDTVEIDADQQKVTVTGYVDREEVLKMVKRTGRAAEFWPFPYSGY